MAATNEEIARALAKEFGIEDEVIEKPPTLLERARFTTLRNLHPGQDFIDGVLYYTAPYFVDSTKTVGKGKKAREIPVVETHTACITSEEELFMFEETELYNRNFNFPEVFLAPQKTAWGGEILNDIRDGRVTYPDSYDLYFRVRKLYEKYMEYADERYYDLMTAWVMAGYVFRVFRTFPYLHFNGTKDSGKSQNLRILKGIGFNCKWTGEMTAPDMYRGIAGDPGVIGIDEQEKWIGERAEALKAILRSGYGEGMEVTRQRQREDGRWERDSFPVYCPKALASINPLDDTTQSRCIIVQMRPALRPITEFDATRLERWKGLRDDLHLWGLANAKAIFERYVEWAQPEHDGGLRFTKAPELNNRAWEISAPLVVVSDYIGGEAFSDEMISWLSSYHKTMNRNANTTDIIRMLALSLPRVLRLPDAKDDWWYSVSQVKSELLSTMDDDVSDKITTGSVAKWLKPLGFTEFRSSKGKEVRILEEDVRRVFRERRIDPFIDDIGWLQGLVDYQTESKRIAMSENMKVEWGE